MKYKVRKFTDREKNCKQCLKVTINGFQVYEVHKTESEGVWIIHSLAPISNTPKFFKTSDDAVNFIVNHYKALEKELKRKQQCFLYPKESH